MIMIDSSIRRIGARRRGYREAWQAVVLNRPDTIIMNFELERAQPPCCTLAGSWRLALRLVEPVPEPGHTDSAIGTITFADSFPAAWPEAVRDSMVRDENGRFDLDYSALVASVGNREASTSWFGPLGPSFAKEAEAELFDHDSVSITLIPRLSHGGLTLWGRLRDRMIAGEWALNSGCCLVRGVFTMRQVP
jgi:hypothetical protein